MDGGWGERQAQQAPGHILSLPASPLLPPQKVSTLLATLPTCGLVVVDIDSFQLEVTIPMIGPGGVDAVFVTDNFPELERHV